MFTASFSHSIPLPSQAGLAEVHQRVTTDVKSRLYRALDRLDHEAREGLHVKLTVGEADEIVVSLQRTPHSNTREL